MHNLWHSSFTIRVGRTALVLVLFSLAAAAQSPSSPGTASIEGVVVRAGTNTPIADVDVELSRVEGTTAVPLAPGAAEAFAAVLTGNAPGLVGGAAPAPVLSPEVRYAKSGGDGRFAFAGLKEGKYRLVAIRVGGAYYPTEYGQRDIRGRGLYFPVASGEVKTDLKLEMVATGAISGRVVDEEGRPMGHVVVLGLTAEYRQGELRLYIERQVLTDSEGGYRLYWLSPIEHYVAAVLEDPQRRTINLLPMGPPGRGGPRNRATSPAVTRRNLPDGSVLEETYGVVYYPSVPDSRSARVIDVRPGETIPGIDISLGVGKSPAHHIRGVVVNGATGQPAPNTQVLAIPRQWSPNALVLTGTSDAKGVFDLAGSLPNSYLLTAALSTQAQLPPGSPAALVAQAAQTTPPQVGYLALDTGSRDAENVTIITSPAIKVSGRVSFEGRPPDDDSLNFAKIRIGLTRDPDLIALPDPIVASPPGASPGQVLSDGTFNMTVAPGDFRLSVAGIPADRYVKSIKSGNDNLLDMGLHVAGPIDNPIEILLASDGGTIVGSVVDERANPLTNVTIALIPETPDLRRRLDLYRSTSSDAQGNFQITLIPPGSYKLFAWNFAPTDAWQNSDFIRNFESFGQVVRVSPGAKQAGIRLNIIPTRK